MISILFFILFLQATTVFSQAKRDQTLLKPAYIDIYSELNTTKKTVMPGNEIIYLFKFINIGSDQPENLEINFYPPNELMGGNIHGNFTRLITDPPQASEGIDHDTTIFVEDNLLKSIKWHIDKFTSPDTQRINIRLLVDSLKVSKNLQAFMTLTCSGFNNSSSNEVSLMLLPELTITKSVSPSGPYSPGDSGSYTIIYRNNGGREIDNIIITDQLPQNIIIGQSNPEPDSIVANDYFWSNEKVPAHHTLDAVRLQNLTNTAEHIFRKSHNNKFLDPFLLKIVEMIEPKIPTMYPADTPSWLIYALDNYQDPGHFEKGISGFSELACRSPAHINRALRKHLNITLSEAVNRAKVNFAARKLIMSDEKIINIALECGIPSLGHFYKIFKDNYGLTPDQYRKQNKNCGYKDNLFH